VNQRRAVFLDRDGVLNQLLPGGPAGTSPQSVAETVIYPDVPATLARLRNAGFLLIVTTNQPDVARGRQTRAGVDASTPIWRRNCRSTTSRSATTTMPISAPAASPNPG
jgi:histidinol phosphatase-like enzyme